MFWALKGATEYPLLDKILHSAATITLFPALLEVPVTIIAGTKLSSREQIIRLRFGYQRSQLSYEGEKNEDYEDVYGYREKQIAADFHDPRE